MKPVITISRVKFPHKWQALFPNGKTVKFGRRGYEDYTIHHNKVRMGLYIVRHRKRENWSARGMYSPGFWSRWLLWSRPNIYSAMKATEHALDNKFKIKIIK